MVDPEELSSLTKQGAAVVLFHASWSRPSSSSKARLEAAVSLASSSSESIRCVWVDMTTEEGEEAGIEWNITEPGQILLFIKGLLCFSISAAGNIDGESVGASGKLLLAAAMVALGRMGDRSIEEGRTVLSDCIREAPSEWSAVPLVDAPAQTIMRKPTSQLPSSLPSQHPLQATAQATAQPTLTSGPGHVSIKVRRVPVTVLSGFLGSGKVRSREYTRFQFVG